MIDIDEIAARYIATCHPYKGRPYTELAEEWGKKLKNGERKIPEEVFARAFPHAWRIYNSGRDLQDYFESLNEGSHNMLIWLFLVNSVRRRLPEEVLKSIVQHAEYCSVKVGQITGGVINMPSLTGRYIFDRDILDWSLCSESSEGYYFLHGFDGGKIHVIRKATEQDFQRFRDWFDEKKRIRDIILLQAYKT
jgi:hypothetical protein